MYVASFLGRAVAVFDRRPSGGAIRQKTGRAGCITDAPRPGCTTGRALQGPFAVTVSPDGKSVYVNDFRGDAIAVFDRTRQGVDYSRKVLAPGSKSPQDYVVFTYDDFQSGQAHGPYPKPPNHIVGARRRSSGSSSGSSASSGGEDQAGHRSADRGG